MPSSPPTSAAASPLPTDDPQIFELDLRGLRRRWADRAALSPIGAEAMRGADRLAQALGVSEERLMEQAGTAVAAAVRALAVDTERWGKGPIVILCGPGNNGGDGYVAARRLALNGAQVVVAVIASEARPTGAASSKNWDRIARDAGIVKVHAPVARDVAVFAQGIEKAAVIVDALLGTGVRGPLREPIRTAVEVIDRAHACRHPGRGRRHTDCSRPVERRAVRSRRLSRSHRHVPPSQDRSRDAAWRRSCGQGAGGADRHPARRGPWLSRTRPGASPAGPRWLSWRPESSRS